MSMAADFMLGFLALLMTALFILIAYKPARMVGLVDYPGGRKQHDAPVPLCGGPAMVTAFLLMVLMFQAVPATRHIGLLAGVVSLALLGMVDDYRDLPAGKRLLAQVLVAFTCVEYFGLLPLENLGDLIGLGDVYLGFAALPFALFCLVGFINAFNFIDGVDGLAGGVAVVALVSFAVLALVAGRFGAFDLLTVLIGCTTGFLFFNLRTHWRARASVFLGDCGSTVLGFVLCWFAIDLTQGSQPAMAPIIAVWILALPVMDTVNVVLSRVLRGHGPFVGSRDHLHHALMMAGYSPRQTVRIIIVIAAALAGVGLLGHRFTVAEPIMCLGFVGLVFIYYACLSLFWRTATSKC
ncbi:MAG: undecaprenyl/decaprenyl-phosphate alpha-N-acetylglucosaminyl 1-phosphate transferase [Gammaproteobacteria bacterium]|nr:undecaprenyl/decaprenyl-phosphate alpha-N-acetylglucosaminyl 1-phosphate transferase [Gammaproteobacteria bacterium]